MKKRMIVACVTTILALMLSGCSSKNEANTEKVYGSSTEITIEEILDGHALGDGESVEVVESTPEKNKQEIEEAIENILQANKGYEYYKVVGAQGDWKEEYNDTNTGRSLINEYNISGRLKNRSEFNIPTGESTMIYLNEETNEYEGSTEVLADNLIEENKKLIGHSYIEDYLENVVGLDTEKEVFETKEKQGDYFIYSTKHGYKVCVNTKNNMLERIVKISDDTKGKFTSDVLYEFKVFDNFTDEELSINAESDDNIDFSKIEIIDNGKQEEVSGESVG
ncbi:hypothetical protein CHL78_010640 [Romboutsia weinsteinii]|uniref:Uncharacterized protein n=1 Tax=Romboutsia weinsteinii TaxID=2020949 RepID=A0A371J2P7_9FIRM|nr:hypothetical protein [Romboutsia weinsteinii]RDY27071.1 hypothetical protein CHL78_010640 [Romboutsia weinsteinii]